MKYFILSAFATIAFFQFSCSPHNGQQTDLSTQKADSARTADSLKQVNSDITDRGAYEARLQVEIDSLQIVEARQDSMYEHRNDVEKKQWRENRDRMNVRIVRLKKRKESAGTIAKDDWAKFKMETDTAVQNLKADWNHMMDKMKAK